MARAAQTAGCQRLAVVSALESNAQSPVFYSRVKGEMEQGLIAMGFAGMLLVQISINVAMCPYIFPVVGLTLPFISYGGSSIITMFAAMGIVSSIKMRALPSWISDRSML